MFSTHVIGDRSPQFIGQKCNGPCRKKFEAGDAIVFFEDEGSYKHGAHVHCMEELTARARAEFSTKSRFHAIRERLFDELAAG